MHTKIEFANFVCTFGDSGSNGLLSRFTEVVWPAFKSRAFVRKLKQGTIFFIDSEIVKVTDEDGQSWTILCGRIVKDTMLVREQVFRDQLIQDHKELRNSPSSLFFIFLENHRLMYVREVVGAPSLLTFGSTCTRIFNDRHKQFLRELKKQSRHEHAINPKRRILSLAELEEEHPFPLVRVTPLTDKGDLQQFIEKFERVERLSIKLLPTNHEEINNDQFWKKLDGIGHEVGSNPQVIFHDKKKKGLSPDVVVEQAASASEFGNAAISIRGTDLAGGVLKGNNTDFTHAVPAPEISRKIAVAAKTVANAFKQSLKSGLIKVPSATTQVVSMISKIFRELS